jgi:hypothetical protein
MLRFRKNHNTKIKEKGFKKLLNIQEIGNLKLKNNLKLYKTNNPARNDVSKVQSLCWIEFSGNLKKSLIYYQNKKEPMNGPIFSKFWV